MGRIHLHTFKATRFTIAELADMSGVPRGTLYQRLGNGWTVEQAVTVPTPAQRRRGVVWNRIAIGETSPSSIARETDNIVFQQKADS